MKFKKGQKKIEGSGIKKGQIRQKTQAWNELGSYIMSEGVDRYLKIINNLTDKEFLDRFEHILEYFKPKLSRVDSDITIDQPIIWQELNYDTIKELSPNIDDIQQ